MNKQKVFALSMSAALFVSSFATPAMAASIGSVAADGDSTNAVTNSTVVGVDDAQSEKTNYGIADIGYNETSSPIEVYASLDTSAEVLLPKTIILNGSPAVKNNGHYVVGVKGDISGTDVINIVPEDETELSTAGRMATKTATITQEKQQFTYADGINPDTYTTAVGEIAAESITAGRWNGDFKFNLQMEENENNNDIPDIPLETVLKRAFGYNATTYTSSTTFVPFTDGKNTSWDGFTVARNYNIYALPLTELGLTSGDVVKIKNTNSDGYIFTLMRAKSTWASATGSSVVVNPGKTGSYTVGSDVEYLYFQVVKQTNVSDTSTRQEFDVKDIPISDLKIYKDSITDENEIDYVSVWKKMVAFDDAFDGYDQKLLIHNVDADYRDDVKEIISGEKRYYSWDIDLMKTSDGVYINCHDVKLGDYTISETTYDELKTAYPDSVYSLDYILEQAKKLNVKLDIQDKLAYWPSWAPAIKQIVDAHDMLDNVYFGFATPNANIVPYAADEELNLSFYSQTIDNYDKDAILSRKNNNQLLISPSMNNGNTRLSVDTLMDAYNSGINIRIGLSDTSLIHNKIILYRQYKDIFDLAIAHGVENDLDALYYCAAIRYVNGL